MTNELTIFRHGGNVPSAAFAEANLPKARLDDGVGGTPWVRITYKAKEWAIKDGAKTIPLPPRIIDGRPEVNPNLDIVILKAAGHLSKRWYAKGWAEGDNNPPDCWSTKGFKPDANVKTPQDEGKGCLNCRWNAFGSKEGSKGKACSDYKNLAVVPVGDIENVALRGPMMLPVPPNSLKTLSHYQAKLEGVQFHYAQVHTRVNWVPGGEQTFQMDFDALTALDDAQARKVVKMLKHPMLDRMLDEEFTPLAGDENQNASTPAPEVQKMAVLGAAAAAEPAPAQASQLAAAAGGAGGKEPPEPPVTAAAAAPQPKPPMTPAEQRIAELEAQLAAAKAPAPEPEETPEERRIRELEEQLATAKAGAAPKPRRGAPRKNGRTPAVQPTDMDSAKLAGPPLPEPVGPGEDVPAPGNDPALDQINATLNRARSLI